MFVFILKCFLHQFRVDYEYAGKDNGHHMKECLVVGHEFCQNWKAGEHLMSWSTTPICVFKFPYIFWFDCIFFFSSLDFSFAFILFPFLPVATHILMIV